TDREEDHALAQTIARKHGVSVIYIQADMAKADQCRALIDKSVAALGSADILVNNAGIQHVAPIEEFPPEQWDRIIAINLTSAFHTIAAAIPHVKQGGCGRIINIASAHGLVAS